MNTPRALPAASTGPAQLRGRRCSDQAASPPPSAMAATPAIRPHNGSKTSPAKTSSSAGPIANTPPTGSGRVGGRRYPDQRQQADGDDHRGRWPEAARKAAAIASPATGSRRRRSMRAATAQATAAMAPRGQPGEELATDNGFDDLTHGWGGYRGEPGRPLRIAMVNQPGAASRPPTPTVSIGIWSSEVARRLVEAGHQVTVYASGEPTGITRQRHHGVDYRLLATLPDTLLSRMLRYLPARRDPRRPRLTSLLTHLGFAVQAAIDIRRRRPDLVHIQSQFPFTRVIRALQPPGADRAPPPQRVALRPAPGPDRPGGAGGRCRGDVQRSRHQAGPTRPPGARRVESSPSPTESTPPPSTRRRVVTSTGSPCCSWGGSLPRRGSTP